MNNTVKIKFITPSRFI